MTALGLTNVPSICISCSPMALALVEALGAVGRALRSGLRTTVPRARVAAGCSNAASASPATRTQC